MSDLEDIEFHWHDPNWNLDTVFRPSIDTPFSPSTLKEFELGSAFVNSILFDEETDKEDSPPFPTTLVPERPLNRPVLTRTAPLKED